MSPDPNTSRPAAGETWEDLLTFTTDPEIGRPGYYALEDDGKTLMDPPVMLTWVDDAPGDADDGAGHFYVADPDKPYYTHLPPHVDSNLVELEATVEGTGEVDVGGSDSA